MINKGNLILELKKGNGLMKEYFANSKLSFEGEYLDGKRYGYGKSYDLDGRLFFEGEFLNNKRHGYGKQYFDSIFIWK